MTSIRQAVPDDYPAIRHVLDLAFGEEPVSALVEDLRRCPGFVPELELVADDGDVVGHVMLTWNRFLLDSGGHRPALVVAPLAVRPDRQRRGIGRALIAGAIDLVRATGEPFALLEGDPAYYGRLGFIAGQAYGIRPPSPTVPEEGNQLHPLSPPDPALSGRVLYDEAFWANAGSGLPEDTDPDGGCPLPYLFHFAQLCGWIEAVAYGADLAPAVPSCPDWTLRDLLVHLRGMCESATSYVATGRCPDAGEPIDDPTGESTEDPRPSFAEAWRETFEILAAFPPTTPSNGWVVQGWTVGRWRRRMAHEAAVHAWDVLAAVPDGRVSSRIGWKIDEDLAVDGIDFVLWMARVILDDRNDGQAVEGGEGPTRCVRIAVPHGRSWTLGARPGRIVALDGIDDVRPEVVIEGSASDIYLWLWGRTDQGRLHCDGDGETASLLVEQVRSALV
jgi:putative acetyltransferase